ncbi:hypothetical protein FOA43_002238 [Brettanomyces nanus]|uniref:Pre-mRNA polyadenylation factor FIP1 n=1 Tax=Eeniella nana TaxID=13502 RepID=A0A875RPD4_EENNA|nr:uncharacterized protein FOA43_002238 [Brettanomyces nanus]QPG74900.1 hypothetical protein FOA43_002238 [Brettanomyces nanus]
MDDDDAFLYGEGGGKGNTGSTGIEAKDGDAVKAISTEDKETNNEENKKAESEEAENEEEDSSDSDVEFVIGSLESKPITDLVQEKDKEEDDVSGDGSVKAQTVPILTESKGLNIDEVGKYHDIPVNSLTFEELKDKPWRLPGADLSDYFNFGFDELSWLAYCKKQNTLRKDFNPAKVIAELMGGGAMPPPPAASSGGQGRVGGGPNMPPPPFMMPPMGMPFMPPNMQMPGMFNGINNNNNNNNSMNNTGGSRTPSLPNIPKLPSRPTSNSKSPEPSNRTSSMPQNSSYRDRADKATEMRSSGHSGNQNYRDRPSRRR